MILFTMMETATLHPDFTAYCNDYSDEIWTPSQANRELFIENGVEKPVKVIPLGIDGRLYFETERRPFPFHECHSIFGVPPQQAVAPIRFLSVINWNPRKGYDALIRAFVNAFKKDDPVALVIAASVPQEVVVNALWPHLPRRFDLPQVMLYNRVIPIEAMPSIYDCVHCYVHLSRGEGFSLTQIEAASRGVPVISCCHTGMTEYLREDNSYPVYCSDRESCDPELNRVSAFYDGQEFWKVGDEQAEQASEIMKRVLLDYAEARTKAEVLRSEVREKYTWNRTAERVAAALREE
jgi:glycosyltransferase involved in cell wall biosynthesis